VREAYAKVAIVHEGVEYVAGLEWRESDNFERLRKQLESAVRCQLYPRDVNLVYPTRAKAIEQQIVYQWPDRAYFLEVGVDSEWAQVYDPRGFVKERCDHKRVTCRDVA
jgi:hypothetical protein